MHAEGAVEVRRGSSAARCCHRTASVPGQGELRARPNLRLQRKANPAILFTQDGPQASGRRDARPAEVAEMAARRKLQAKGVARIDDPGRHGVGWYARVTFRGKTHSKYFADGVHGGKGRAFDRAVEWRDATEKALGKPRTDRMLPGTSSRSHTGVAGVYKSRNSYVVAWMPEEGELRREFVNITRYGEAEAFRRAVELRRKRERLVYGKAVSNAPVARLRRRAAPRKQASRKRTRR